MPITFNLTQSSKNSELEYYGTYEKNSKHVLDEAIGAKTKTNQK